MGPEQFRMDEIPDQPKGMGFFLFVLGVSKTEFQSFRQLFSYNAITA